MRQILSALAYMHRKGIVHHDIKPSNLTLQSNAEHGADVYLIDFGLAKKVRYNKLISDRRWGSAGYAAPELLSNQGYDT